MKRSQPLNTLTALSIHLFYDHAEDDYKGSPDYKKIIWKVEVEDFKEGPV